MLLKMKMTVHLFTVLLVIKSIVLAGASRGKFVEKNDRKEEEIGFVSKGEPSGVISVSAIPTDFNPQFRKAWPFDPSTLEGVKAAREKNNKGDEIEQEFPWNNHMQFHEPKEERQRKNYLGRKVMLFPRYKMKALHLDMIQSFDPHEKRARKLKKLRHRRLIKKRDIQTNKKKQKKQQNVGGNENSNRTSERLKNGTEYEEGSGYTHTGEKPEKGEGKDEAKHRIMAHKRHRLMTLLALLETDCFNKSSEDKLSDGDCPRKWDGVICWDPVQPQSAVYRRCPEHVPGMGLKGFAIRVCDSSGNWATRNLITKISELNQLPRAPYNDTDNSTDWVYPLELEDDTNASLSLQLSVLEDLETTSSGSLLEMSTAESADTSWTDYGQCVQEKQTDQDLKLMEKWLPYVRQTSLIGYSLSLVLLIISFCILASLKKLRCPRNLLHLHLFASFIFRALVVLLRSSLLSSPTLTPAPTHAKEVEMQSLNNEGDSWFCRSVVVVWQYFITANYSWILMEGLYLHNLIFRALFTDSSAITLYVILGWGLPLFFVGCWAVVRILVDNSMCWMIHHKIWVFIILIRVPVAFSVFLNFFFFVNVVRVLVKKLKSSVFDESTQYGAKLAKSTLVLVPLFGAHYCLLWGLSISSEPSVELAWLLMDQVFASFQGFFVAVLYCLMNGEVRQELRKIYNSWFGDDSRLFFNGYSTVMSNTRIYTSRAARSSFHSIHSTTTADRRGDRTTSPGSAKKADPIGGKMMELSPNAAKMNYSVTEELIELQPQKNSLSKITAADTDIPSDTLHLSNKLLNGAVENKNLEENSQMITTKI